MLLIIISHYKLDRKCTIKFIKISNYFTLAVIKLLGFNSKNLMYNKLTQRKKYLDQGQLNLRLEESHLKVQSM